MTYRNRQSFFETALGKSVDKLGQFDESKNAYVYPAWLPEQPAFSATGLASKVQSHARVLIHTVPRRREQYAQRYCSAAFKSLMRLYPDVCAQSPEAAQDMRTLFREFGTKKVQRQFDGLAVLTDKRAETAANIQRKMKPRQHLLLSPELS